ncbi:MAG: cytochrome c biogenesis protein CcsA, partial [Bacteroidia bacterium]|nr:cytochrome c biogenesis protein CcsA [Bacteroidia bacterium]
LAFVSALFSAIAYFNASKEISSASSWKKLARLSFRIHSLAVLGIVATLFYMLRYHLFEYEYVWHHSNTEMRMRYILSCFWEGQEGSFLLWSFWHVVIGNILIRTAKDWEAPVMATVAAVQMFLASMLLGVYIFEYKIGSNPFTVLLREHPDFGNIPLFQNPNYLAKLDGRGLNPLLQNYWMTIHPPTLFLGFALTLVPFAYAIAGLWNKKFDEWQKPALPWTFVGIAILGTGILMGGAWAYEALSFGGFWAWDPVENSSLVPWLTLVGSAHVMLIHKHKGQSLFTAFFLTLITFILILYSTFLTRSGILGETSVHAFTDLGMSGQLLLYLFFFMGLAIVLLIVNRKHFQKTNEEEAVWSREFWMFLGALVLLISSFHIMFNTSMPVWNKLFNLKMAPPANAIGFYNSWQIPFAIIITLLIATGQFLKYKDTDIKTVVKKLIFPFIGSILLCAIVAIAMRLDQFFYVLLLWSSVFCVWANAHYWLIVLSGKIKNAGASIAHIGFGLILTGALISTSKKEFISVNNSGKDIETLDKQLTNSKNILLQVGDTLRMGDYFVTYKGKLKQGVNIYFEIEYYKKQPDGKLKYDFTLKPVVQTNPRMGNVAEPDTRHFLHKDIYTHVTYADLETLEEKKQEGNEYGTSKSFTIAVGDTISS